MADASNRLLESLVRATIGDLHQGAEDAAFRGIESMLGIVVGGGLQFALGPFGFVVPWTKVLTWGARIGYHTFKDYNETSRSAATAYDIRTTSSGLVVAENTDPITLTQLPLVLPRRAEFKLSQLVAPQPRRVQLLVPSELKRVDGEKVFRDYWSLTNRHMCPECRQKISTLGSMQLGHLLNCSRNTFLAQHRRAASPYKTAAHPRASRRCIACGSELGLVGGEISGHADWCFLNADKLKLQPSTPALTLPRRMQDAKRVEDARKRDEYGRRAAVWRNSPLNPLNPNSILNPNHPFNPNNPLNPSNPRNPANPLNPMNPLNPNNPINRHRRR